MFHKYNLYDIYVYTESEISKSIGIFGELSLDDLRFLLIKKMYNRDFLDGISRNVVSNGKFWEILLNIDRLSMSKYYKNGLYAIDIMLLEMESDDANTILQQYSSNWSLIKSTFRSTTTTTTTSNNDNNRTITFKPDSSVFVPGKFVQ